MTIPLYLHIPKCGGSTITHVLYQQCSERTENQEKTKYWHRGVYFYPAGLFSRPSNPSNPDVARMLMRADLRAVVGHFAFGIHNHITVPSAYVTALRNPVSRMISLYDELIAQKRIVMPLEAFVSNPPFADMENDQTRRIAGDSIQTENGEAMLKTARYNLKNHFTVVGLTERMDETLCVMHRVFGWSKHVFYYPKNVTLKRTDPDAISSGLLQLIGERNHLDVRLYAFAQQLLEEAIRKQGEGFAMELAEYKESIRHLIEQTNVDSLEHIENIRTHELVLEILNKGKSR